MKNNKKAFTLVELMIVIVIIGILAAIIIPTVSGAITRSKLAADEADVANMNKELSIALIDNNESYFSAEEVVTILSNYSLIPRVSDYSYWYDRQDNRIILSNDSNLLQSNANTVFAADATYPKTLEAISSNPAYVFVDQNPDNPISAAISGIRKLANNSTVTTDAFNTLVNNLDDSIKTHLNAFSPESTLYISNRGFFTAKPLSGSAVNFANVIFAYGTTNIPAFNLNSSATGSTPNSNIIVSVDGGLEIPCTVTALTQKTVTTVGSFEKFDSTTKIIVSNKAIVKEGTVNPASEIAQTTLKPFTVIPVKYTDTVVTMDDVTSIYKVGDVSYEETSSWAVETSVNANNDGDVVVSNVKGQHVFKAGDSSIKVDYDITVTRTGDTFALAFTLPTVSGYKFNLCKADAELTSGNSVNSGETVTLKIKVDEDVVNEANLTLTAVPVPCPSDGTVIFIPKGTKFYVAPPVGLSGNATNNIEVLYYSKATKCFEARVFDSTGVLIARSVVNYIEV